MKDIVSRLINKTISYIQQVKLERILPVVLVFSLFLATNMNLDADRMPIGERVAKQQHQTSVKSERPKTTGEFIDEARQDIPLDERIGNITRDSREAFGQFGEGIANSVKESVKEIGKNVSDVAK